MIDKISFEDFKKIEIKIGKIVAAEKIEKSDKLLKLEVDFGDPSTSSGLGRRQIVSGIANDYDSESLVDKSFVFITNLESRQIMGLESQGMILAADVEGHAILLEPNQEVNPGTLVR